MVRILGRKWGLLLLALVFSCSVANAGNPLDGISGVIDQAVAQGSKLGKIVADNLDVGVELEKIKDSVCQFADQAQSQVVKTLTNPEVLKNGLPGIFTGILGMSQDGLLTSIANSFGDILLMAVPPLDRVNNGIKFLGYMVSSIQNKSVGDFLQAEASFLAMAGIPNLETVGKMLEALGDVAGIVEAATANNGKGDGKAMISGIISLLAKMGGAARGEDVADGVIEMLEKKASTKVVDGVTKKFSDWSVGEIMTQFFELMKSDADFKTELGKAILDNSLPDLAVIPISDGKVEEGENKGLTKTSDSAEEKGNGSVEQTQDTEEVNQNPIW